MNIRWWCMLVLLCILRQGYAADIQRKEMRVLYVGYSPEKEMPAYTRQAAGYASEQRFAEDVRTRMPAFRELLLRYFTEVSTVDARDYKQEMSQAYDVTIFDALPVPVIPKKDILGEGGKFLRTESAKYFSTDFDCPAVFIAHTGGILQQGLNLKIDWCCLCLGGYAHQVRTGHRVFKGPFPVKLHFEQRPAPLTIYNYLNGYAQADRIPMWRVQTSGYRDGKGQRIGLVSFGEGFNDSPDAEAIAGGESLKAVNTVSIGRHGNFLLWGFAASPKDLTLEAQAVFANCVAYISRFRGQLPVVRKIPGQAMTTREFVDDLLWVVSANGYQEYVHKRQLVNADREKQREVAQQQIKEKGEFSRKGELDKMYAASEIMSREEFYRAYLGEELAKRAITNRKGCRKYILANHPYFYGAGSSNRFIIDEDVAGLKIANSDKYLLEKCISLWEKGEKAELPKRVLCRYTNRQFATPAEWRDWYEKNRRLLFFTETGGYKFIENTKCSETLMSEVKEDDAPVRVMAKVLQKDGRKYVSIVFQIKKGHHIYGTLVEGSPFIPTTLTFEFPEKIQKAGELKKPVEVLLEGGEGIMVYGGNVEFLQEIVGDGKGVLKCTVSYQCCNDLLCMPPVKEEVLIEVE